MREYIKKPENQSRALESNPKASKQAPISEILQAYKNGTLGRQPMQRESVEDEDLLQSKTSGQTPTSVILQRYKDNIQRYSPEEDEELLQGKFESTPTTEEESTQGEENANNTGLPDNLKSGIENLSGYSMNDVKVHYNSSKPTQLHALAYAQGTDIHIAPGQEKHLPHEAWHVVQQKQGRVQPTMQLRGVNVDDNEGLEKEADEMGKMSEDYDKACNTQLKGTMLSNQLIIQRITETEEEMMTKIASIDLDNISNLPVMIKLLEEAQGNGWELAEDTLIKHVRKMEDERDDIISANEEGRKFELISKLLAIISDAEEIELKMAINGLFPFGSIPFLNEQITKQISLQVRASVLLYRRIISILTKGILSPNNLKTEEFTPSSDMLETSKVSYFDIDTERTHYNPQFPREERYTAGTSSLSVSLERQDDYKYLGIALKAIEEKKNEKAIKDIQKVVDKYPGEFKEPLNIVTPDNAREICTIINKYPSMISDFLLLSSFFKPILEKRAQQTAMFISTDHKNPLLKIHDAYTPKTKELRTDMGLENKYITQVLLPQYMSGFLNILKTNFKEKEFILVPNSVETSLSYYNMLLRAKFEVKLPAPDYQSAIEGLIKRGYTRMITHITRV